MPPEVIQSITTVLASAGVASLISLFVGRHFERQRWLRDEKLRSAVQFLSTVYEISGVMIKTRPLEHLHPNFLDKVIQSEHGSLSLVSAQAVIEHAQKVTASISAWVEEHSKAVEAGASLGAEPESAAFAEFRSDIAEFLTAVRADLGTASKAERGHAG